MTRHVCDVAFVAGVGWQAWCWDCFWQAVRVLEVQSRAEAGAHEWDEDCKAQEVAR